MADATAPDRRRPGPDGEPRPDVELADVRRALVVGLGASGRAAAAALAEHGVEVVAVDDDPGADGSGLAAGVEVLAGRSGTSEVAGVDLVVPSPGVPYRAPVLAAAREHGRPVWSEPELAHRLFGRRVVAITGTNGKTSTTELTTAMLRAAGIDAVSCGNIGTPLVVAAAAAPDERVLVAELSSFQLEHAHRLRAEVGALLNLADDHLDWHGSRAAYELAKARMWHGQHDDDWAVANADDPAVMALTTEHVHANLAVFSGSHLPGKVDGDGDGPAACGVRVGVGVTDGRLVSTIPVARGTILALRDLPLQAPHHHANVAAAATAAILAGADHEAIAEAARAYRPGRHRMEVVASARGVTWVDDSKATNPHAAAAALDGVRSAVWIAGGLAKGVDLSPLAEHLGRVRVALLIGEAAPALAALCERVGVEARHCDSIEAACEQAAGLARPGDTVLLAPACASFDQFRDYAERGDRFAAAARDVASG